MDRSPQSPPTMPSSATTSVQSPAWPPVPDQDDPAVRAAQEERLFKVWEPPTGVFFRWTDTNNDAVGAWYTDFRQLTDQDVTDILARRRRPTA